jgi:hypothetical protein
MKKILLGLALVSCAAFPQEAETPTHVAINVQTFNALVNYLGNRPYIEVADIMEGIKQAQYVNIKEDEK